MSYEGDMLRKFDMPQKMEVEEAILKTLFKHNGTIKEFAAEEEIVDEIAELFTLKESQRVAVLERIYRKENRPVKTPLWHRLLYRAADSLAKERLVSRPKSTVLLTNKREWMLTEEGFEKALKLLQIPPTQKEFLPVKSYEVEKVVKKIKETPSPCNYIPFDIKKKIRTESKETTIRARGFRIAVIESYDYRCSICGLKLSSPDSHFWEVEAAHIVPNSSKGRDDIWNGLALCHFHHWAFDVGWFSLTEDYKVIVSSQSQNLPHDCGIIDNYQVFKDGLTPNKPLILPANSNLYPHKNSLHWHRQNILQI